MATADMSRVPDRLNVLVVEDEPGIRFLAVEMLQEAGGFAVWEAGDVETALALLAQDGDIHCVFTDVRMPGPHDGLYLAQQVRTQYPAVTVIITSGHILAGAEVGDLPFLAKPYNLGTLPDLIRAHANR